MRSAVELLERVGLPASLEQERFLLGTLLQVDPHDVDDIRGLIGESTDIFTVQAHKHIWESIWALRERGDEVCLVSVASQLRDSSRLEASGGIGFLADLSGAGVPGVALEGSVRALEAKSARRRAVHALNEAMIRCLEPGDNGTDPIEFAISLLEKAGEAGAKTGSLKSAEALLNEIGFEAFCSPAKNVRMGAVEMPDKWPQLKQLVPSLKKGQLITIAGATSHGKTAFALDLLLALSVDHPVAAFSLEMSAHELLTRAACNLSGVDSYLQESSNLSSKERARFSSAVSRLAEMPLYIDDRTGSTVAAIASAAAKVRPKPRLLCVDYLQLLNASGKAANRNDAVSQISRGLKQLAVRMEIPIIVLSQINRDSRKEGREPDLHDLRDSGSIEQDSNTVIFLWQTKDEEGRPYSRTDILVKKQRGGRKGRVTMNFEKPFQRFVEL